MINCSCKQSFPCAVLSRERRSSFPLQWKTTCTTNDLSKGDFCGALLAF